MTITFGVSKNGFKAKEFAVIKDELEIRLRAEVDPELHFGSNTIAGVITAIVSNQARQVWEALNGLYHSLQPETATGRALNSLCSLTGIYRKKATCSKAAAILELEGKARVAKGSRVQSISGHFFKVTREVYNAGGAKIEIEADLVAEETGPTVGHPKIEAKIMTPTTGFRKAVFKQTYELGRHDETDEELRLRRFIELKAIGSSPADGLRSRLKQLDHVESVFIKEGPRSFETIIKGGNDQEIANAIWQCKPLGVETAGSVTCTITDSIKTPRIIRFSRPVEIPLTLHANIKVRRLLADVEDAIVNIRSIREMSLLSCSTKLESERLAARLRLEATADITDLDFPKEVSNSLHNAVARDAMVKDVCSLSVEGRLIFSSELTKIEELI